MSMESGNNWRDPVSGPQTEEEAQRWLESYERGALTPEQRESFEAYAMDKPALLESMELSLMLKEGLLADLRTPTMEKQTGTVWLSRAAIAVAALTVGALVGTGLNAPEQDGPLLANNAQVVDLPIVRSDDEEAEQVSMSDGTNVVVLRIPLPVVDGSRFAVELMPARGEALPTVEADITGAGTLDVAYSRAALRAGEYTLTVRSLNDQSVIRSSRLTLQ